MRKDKIWEVDLFDQRPYSQKNAKQLSNPEFWTSDTEAFLVFKLFNNVVPDSATLNLYNRDDKSLVVDLPMVINNQDAKFELTEEIIAHFGSWSAQAVFSIDGESYTTSTVSFSVGRELGADLPERLGVIEEWKDLNSEVKSFVAEIEGFTLDQFVELKMGEELANLETNYATRLTGLEQKDNQLTAQLAQTKNEVLELIGNVADGTPLFADNVSGMTDTTRIYLNTTDGYLYAYDGTSFKSTGVVYLSNSIEEYMTVENEEWEVI